MPRFNMKSLGFISKYTHWTFLSCFLVNLSAAIGADLTCSGPLGYNVTPLSTGYGMVNMVKEKITTPENVSGRP